MQASAEAAAAAAALPVEANFCLALWLKKNSFELEANVGLFLA